MTSTELWQSIVNRWNSHNIPHRRGTQPDEITSFEAKHGVVLPKAVREYFLFVDGTGGNMDEWHFCFWPLSDVKPVYEQLDGDHYPDRYAYPDCYVFADYCVDCWDYAFRLTRDSSQPAPVFRVTGGDTPGEMMAESFLEFMCRYLAEPDSVM